MIYRLIRVIMMVMKFNVVIAEKCVIAKGRQDRLLRKDGNTPSCVIEPGFSVELFRLEPGSFKIEVQLWPLVRLLGSLFRRLTDFSCHHFAVCATRSNGE
jgi:hypothetical protein